MTDFFLRLDKYMKFKGLNDNKMTIGAGISPGLIGKARRRGSLSQENISKILQKYTELSADWLFTGEGSMLKSHNGSIGTEILKTYDHEFLESLKISQRQLCETLEKQEELIDKLQFLLYN